MARVIGIDLGTTNSCVAYMEGTSATVIPNQEGGRTTPSMVSVSEAGERMVGQIAKRQAVTNGTSTVFGVKRLIGRKFKDGVFQEVKETLPFATKEAKNGDIRVVLHNKEYAVEEISAMILGKIKEMAEDYLGEEITDAVITVPAYFSDGQRQATKDAGRIAGLNVLRIINEPTAAALAYGIGQKDLNQNVVVYDLGGGTFDVSILHISDDVFEVLSTSGDTFLGGDNFDEKLIQFLIAEFKKSNDLDLSKDGMALQRLKEAVEKAKIELSSANQTEVNLPFVAAGPDGPVHLILTVTREQLESLVVGLVERTESPCMQALEDAGLSVSEIDEVLLVGGMTRMPIIQAKVKEIFKKEPNKQINPDEAVAVGAAMQGGILDGRVEDVLLLDVTPLSLGVETAGGVFTRVIDRNTTIPTRQTKVFSTAEDNQDLVHIHVLQGEREMAEDNSSLARFQLVGIPPAPRGVPQIEVGFEIDANGILNVSAMDLGTGKSHSVKVQATSGLNEGEIKRIVGEADSYKEQDLEAKQLVELRNKAEGLIHSTTRSLEEYGDLLDEEGIAAIRDAIEKVQLLRNENDPTQLENAIESLEKSAHKISEALYGN